MEKCVRGLEPTEEGCRGVVFMKRSITPLYSLPPSLQGGVTWLLVPPLHPLPSSNPLLLFSFPFSRAPTQFRQQYSLFADLCEVKALHLPGEGVHPVRDALIRWVEMNHWWVRLGSGMELIEHDAQGLMCFNKGES